MRINTFLMSIKKKLIGMRSHSQLDKLTAECLESKAFGRVNLTCQACDAHSTEIAW